MAGSPVVNLLVGLTLFFFLTAPFGRGYFLLEYCSGGFEPIVVVSAMHFLAPSHKICAALPRIAFRKFPGMIHKSLIAAGLIATFTMSIVVMAQSADRDDIVKVREATAQFQRTPAARAAGYEPMPGLDDCFQSYGIGGMGYHFINNNLLDTTVDLLHPEAMVYAPDANGSIQPGAVEYIVPAAAWDAEHTELPRLFGHRFHLSERLGAYVLHVWVWKNNPSGMFEDWNPDVSCPEPLHWDGPSRWR